MDSAVKSDENIRPIASFTCFFVLYRVAILVGCVGTLYAQKVYGYTLWSMTGVIYTVSSGVIYDVRTVSPAPRNDRLNRTLYGIVDTAPTALNYSQSPLNTLPTSIPTISAPYQQILNIMSTS